MLDSNEMGKIDRLKRGLYSRKAPDIIDLGRDVLPAKQFEAPTNWEHTESNSFDVLASKVAHSANRHHSVAKKIFFISLGIFVASLVMAGLVFFGGVNTISSKNVDIEVVGPVSVGGGQETSFEVLISNKNSTDLESAKLTVEYPSGTRQENNLSQDMTSEVLEIGKIGSGSKFSQPIKIFLFGKKDEIKQFRFTLDYRIKNSNGSFFKEKNHEIAISSSPIIITSTYPKEVNSNQDINFSMEVFSNTADAPKDMLVSISYPFGFSFSGASPPPSFGNNTWKLSNIKQGDKHVINISGSIQGQDNEERIFKISAGTPSLDDERVVGIVLISSDESIIIKKPFIGIDFDIEGANGDYIASASENINTDIKVRNNLPEKIFNIETKIALSGPALSTDSIFVNQNGFFRSIDNTIVWDKRAVNQFNQLEPGESTDLSFRFSAINYALFPKGSKPEVKIKVMTSADRILDSGQVDRIYSTQEKTVKLATKITLNSKLIRNQGNIKNSGPIPPKANNKTTYTVVWSLLNSFNNASNVMVRATLPQYVEWTNVVDPANSAVSYDPNTHQVIWNAGQLTAGTGYGISPKEVYFQISFLPSTSQIGSEPELIGGTSISGIDKVTGITVESSSSSLTTEFLDSSYREGDEKVVN